MKKDKFLIIGMLAMVLVFGLAYVGCATDKGGGETEARTFAENMLGDWSKESDSLEIGFFEHKGRGRLRLPSPLDENSVLEEINGNNYTLSPTGRYYMWYSFTATIGTNGKLIISDAIETPSGENTISLFTGSPLSINDLNGTWTKK
jgi:hypothetical protein